MIIMGCIQIPSLPKKLKYTSEQSIRVHGSWRRFRIELLTIIAIHVRFLR